MKMLDEVIIALEESRVQTETGTGYWVGYRDNDDLKADALHYLKEYNDIKTTMDWHKEMEVIRNGIVNPPLTWDELKQMGGKAVWIEGTHHKHWCIIKGIARKDLSEMEYITLAYLNNKNRIVTYDRRKGNFDVTWQAYRKERANENLG